MAKRCYGVYYRCSQYQDWQPYVGFELLEEARREYDASIAQHPGRDWMIATYPEGYLESWRKEIREYKGVDRSSAPIGSAVSGIINTLESDWF